MQRLLHCSQVNPERKAKTAEKYFSWAEFNLYINSKDFQLGRYFGKKKKKHQTFKDDSYFDFAVVSSNWPLGQQGRLCSLHGK